MGNVTERSIVDAVSVRSIGIAFLKVAQKAVDLLHALLGGPWDGAASSHVSSLPKALGQSTSPPAMMAGVPGPGRMKPTIPAVMSMTPTSLGRSLILLSSAGSGSA